MSIRNEMLGTVREQQASEVFLRTLWTLLEHGHARIANWHVPSINAIAIQEKPLIGRTVSGERRGGRLTPMPPRQPGSEIFDIATSMAMEEVQTSLRRQGKPELRITERTLIDQLVEAGVLLDQQNLPIAPNVRGERTRLQRLEGDRRANVFRISLAALSGQSVSVTGTANEQEQTGPQNQGNGNGQLAGGRVTSA